jgi:thiol-disulfide isomerase/thioredoxin
MGRFEIWLADDTPRFHVAIHAPGFLQCFEVGPFTLADVKDGMLPIDVPRPATLEVSFEPGDYPDAAAPFKGAVLNVYWRLKGNSILNVASTEGTLLTPKLTLTDLAPGGYMVEVRTQPKEASAPAVPANRAEINLGSYYDRVTPNLEAGQIERIDFRSTPFDPNAFRGDRTATVRIRMPDGAPAADHNASVTYYDGHYGSQVVFSGAVPESGEIVLAGITDKIPRTSASHPPYTVNVNGKRLGAFAFATEPLAQEFEFSLAPGVGDLAPDLELTRVANGEPLRLSSFRGKVLLVEFWATWCGPCQEPMAKLNSLVAEQSAWKDRVAVVPISIDAELAQVKSHVDSRGWNALEQCWAGGNAGAEFDSPVAKKYVISGVPESILIGVDGRILWRGHPMSNSDGKDIQARIENALK